jgi:hypothetical protein|tara:strand:- start:2512 stop:2961 length:450 start_codon:yes stop_codon:yes gene_type:complete
MPSTWGRTYESAVENADHLQALGQHERVVIDPPYPWHLVTAVGSAGSHRLDMDTSVRFVAEDAEHGLTFNWIVDVEDRSANGKGHYEIKIAMLLDIQTRLTGQPLADFQAYLRKSADAVQAKGEEWMKIARRQLDTASALRISVSEEAN